MTEFINIKQGQGSIFNFPIPSTPPPLTRIGTHGCRTCVCVYITIDSNQCFIAHLDAHVAFVEGDSGWMPTAAQGQTLKDFTKKVLTERVPKLANGDYSAKPGRTGAIVICPSRVLPLNGVNVPATGLYVVEAVNEFFNLKHESADVVTRAAHGFVVDHHTGQVEFLEFAGATGEELTRWYRLVDIADVRDLTPEENQDVEYLQPRIPEKTVEEYGFKELDCELRRDWTFLLNDKGEWTVARTDATGRVLRTPSRESAE